MRKFKLWLHWMLYVIVTQEERMMYDYGRYHKRKCTGITKELFGTVFHSEPGTTERKFLKRKEYFKLHENGKNA